MLNGFSGVVSELRPALDEAVSLLSPSEFLGLVTLEVVKAVSEMLDPLLKFFWDILSLLLQSDDSDHISNGSHGGSLGLVQLLGMSFGSVLLLLEFILPGLLIEVKIRFDFADFGLEACLGSDFLKLALSWLDLLLLDLVLEFLDHLDLLGLVPDLLAELLLKVRLSVDVLFGSAIHLQTLLQLLFKL